MLERRFKGKLREWLAGAETADWPLIIPLGLPTEQLALRQVDAVREWVAAWRAWGGRGELRWADRQWRQLGAQQMPEALILATPADVAAWTGQQDRWQQSARRHGWLTERWPGYGQQLARYDDVLADYSEADFVRLVDMVEWIVAHPDSGLYPRQIPLAGVDSKWIESRQGVIASMSAMLLGRPSGAGFHASCGLKWPPVAIRLRILDPALRAAAGGLSDVIAPVDELGRLGLAPATVFIVENLQSGLALEELPGAVAFTGLGYGVELLRQIPWIAGARCVYWGDIDTHGLAILAKARQFLPELASVLMDVETLLRAPTLWSNEPRQDLAADPVYLTDAELDLYQGLRQQRWGQNIRLEQERLAWDHVAAVLIASSR
ncbi:DUF2220 family protein [Massilia sp. H-1]|nr:DUF2220 family protein [Massilia sp. H-1]